MNYRQPNPQYSETNYLRLPIAERRQPTADSRILNPFSEQVINVDISNELPTAERQQPTAESSIQPNPQYSRILNPFSEQIIYGYR